jgi:hypothetical protein
MPENMVTMVYNVGDLVVQIQNNSNFGIGGIGGGMMGGMGGGMGGGMMGGGMGGGMMGGGMGGGLGGMGGGMVAVEDDLSLVTKRPVEAPAATPVATPASDEQPQLRRPANRSLGNSGKAERINVQAADGETSADAWDRYFGEQQARLALQTDASAASRELLASVRETVRQLMHEKKYGEVPVLIQSALRNGIIESWMYEAMGLAMQADQAPAEELERALMSAVDLAGSPEELMFIISYMDHVGLHQRSLSLCRGFH